MYSHTRKVGSLGRYGARVGRKIRHEARKIEDEAKKPKICQRCGKNRVKRNAAGIWTCRSCGLVFAGGAYTPAAVKKEMVQATGEKEAEPKVHGKSPAKTEGAVEIERKKKTKRSYSNEA